MEPIITSEEPNRTITKFEEDFAVASSINAKLVYLTIEVYCTKVIAPSHLATLYGGDPSPNYLIKPAEKIVTDRDLGIKGKDLKGCRLTIVSSITKIDAEGMGVTDDELDNELLLKLKYKLVAGTSVLAEFEIDGKNPKQVVESFRTTLKFKM